MASTPMAQPSRPVRTHEWQRFTYRYLGPGLRYIVLIPLALLFLFPFYLMIRTAVITQPEVASFDWVWWPQETHWRENLEGIFNDQTAPMSVGLRNSAIIAGANLLLQTLFASMAGYALARLPVRGQQPGLLLDPHDADGPQRGDLHPELRRRRQPRRRQHAVGDHRARALQCLRGLPLPPVLPRLPGRDRRSGPARRAKPRRDLLAAGAAELGRRPGGARHPQLHQQLERVPLAAGNRSAPLLLDIQIVLSTYITAQTINLPYMFMGAVVGALPLVIVFLVMQRYIVEGVRLSGIKG